MIRLLGWVLGLAITILVKQVLVRWCRTCFYAGFYRTNPMAANLTALALECWFIGLGGGVLVGRFLQFLLAACYFVGRTDVPFLSTDVALVRMKCCCCSDAAHQILKVFVSHSLVVWLRI